MFDSVFIIFAFANKVVTNIIFDNKMTLNYKTLNPAIYFGLILFIVPIYFFFIQKIDNSNQSTSNNNAFITPPYTEYETQWVDSVFAKMTLDEKIGQLFMVAAYPKNGQADKDRMTNLINKYKVGGIIFFKSGPVRQANLTNYYQSISKTPLMIAGDYEWGLSMRMDSTIRFPRQMTLGAIKNNKLVYDFGEEVARQCKRMAININFAPVIDVNNNPANPVINSRSFGEDKINVANKGIAYMFGLQDNKIMATAKHFPGHGDTNVDSHKDLPIINHSRKRLDTLEMYPFKRLINSGLSAVMIAHLSIPSLEKNIKTPSSLSRPIVTDILKNELKFKGLVFTDALGMHGVTKYHKPGETEVLALIAGADVLLMPKDVPIAIAEIKKAIKNKKISISEINKKCKKILKSKRWFNLQNYTPINTKNLYTDLNSDYAKNLNRKLIEASTTIVKNENNILPLVINSNIKTASIAIGNGNISSFQQTLKLYEDVKNFAISNTSDAATFNKKIEILKKYDRVIISIHKISFTKKNYGISPTTVNFISKLAEETEVIVTVFGTPYALSVLKNTNKYKAVVLAYSDKNIYRKFAAEAIYGGINVDGKLPVSTGNFIIPKKEINIKKIRLQYSNILELNINPIKIAQIDSTIKNAIKIGATPGATILAIKEGKVFYHKSFGYHTYQKKTKTKNSDLYDLASLTKILATTSSIMILYDQKKIDVNQKLSKYYAELDSTNKKDIVISEVLAHQAGLASWIPFYLKTYEDRSTNTLSKEIYSNKRKKKFNTEVAKGLYILDSYKDSIYARIFKTKIKSPHKYKYSDLGFYLFYQMIEKITNTAFDEYTYNNLYAPLGAYTLGFNPLKKFKKENILPTENDTFFRKQLLQGYVHDYGAAMTGGVNGHAGLFSNANDVAKIMQMLLQKGTYGNKRYIKKTTVELFTTCAFCNNDNRRALGFDKVLRGQNGIPSHHASDKSFGHSGFTGTFVWADPESEFVYIFLSNRVYPNSENNKLLKLDIRTKIHSYFYESFPKAVFPTQYIN